jgi:hypothetical protein
MVVIVLVVSGFAAYNPAVALVPALLFTTYPLVVIVSYVVSGLKMKQFRILT